MYVACLWSHWEDAGEALNSFAQSPTSRHKKLLRPGHDRCIIPIKEENIGAWLNPDASKLDALHAILDDRVRPYYEHRMAA